MRASARPCQLLSLLNAGVSPDTASDRGITLLVAAVRFEHTEIVEFLLQTERVNPDARYDGFRRNEASVLSAAADRGSVDITRLLLLQRGRVNPNSEDYSGRTPLSYAA